jgi:hypothetical protein
VVLANRAITKGDHGKITGKNPVTGYNIIFCKLAAHLLSNQFQPQLLSPPSCVKKALWPLTE